MTTRMTVLGGGTGGYTAAFAAARAGMDVTLIEQDHLGGTCLNRGCIPTKTLKASADALELALRLHEFGISCQGVPKPDMPAIMARKDRVRDVLRGGLEKTCAKHKVTLLRGQGKLLSPRTLEILLPDGSRQQVENDVLILATGSRVLELPALPFDHSRILSSDDALALEQPPARLLIVGGGVIGCEMACIFRAFGSQVTIVEGLNRLLPLPAVDGDISKLLQKEMKKRGIVSELGRTLHSVELTPQGVRGTLGPSPFLTTHSPAQSKESPVEADAVLVTVGRAANTDALGLEAAGIATDARGWIVVDDMLQTSQPGVYAVGDALGPRKIMLAHVAAAEALCAVGNCQSAAPRPMEYRVVPSGIFTTPEIGCVGMSEEEATAAGLAVHCPLLHMRELGKAQAMGELPGFFKLVAHKPDGRILGAHIAGAHASDLVAELALAMRMNATIADIASTIHAHPTLAEGVYEAALLGGEGGR